MLKLKFKESNFKIIVRKLYTILCSSLVLVNIFFFKKIKKLIFFMEALMLVILVEH